LRQVSLRQVSLRQVSLRQVSLRQVSSRLIWERWLTLARRLTAAVRPIERTKYGAPTTLRNGCLIVDE
jgi:hypothetical protein